jgi:hypothetical protein
VTGDKIAASESARVERSPADEARVAAELEQMKRAAAAEARDLSGPEPASYQVRLFLEPANDHAGRPPTLPQLTGALEAFALQHYPDFIPSVRAERLDRD